MTVQTLVVVIADVIQLIEKFQFYPCIYITYYNLIPSIE